jgi:hypothetical protein
MMPKRGMVPNQSRAIGPAVVIPISTLEHNERKSLKIQALYSQSNISGW